MLTHLVAGVEYNDSTLFQLPGGREAIVKIGLPTLREMIDESKRETLREAKIKDLMTVLVARVGSHAEALENMLKTIGDRARSKELLKHAAKCRTLGSFRERPAP